MASQLVIHIEGYPDEVVIPAEEIGAEANVTHVVAEVVTPVVDAGVSTIQVAGTAEE